MCGDDRCRYPSKEKGLSYRQMTEPTEKLVLDQRIEVVRSELNELVKQRQQLGSKEVLEKSRDLDRLINMYNYLQSK